MMNPKLNGTKKNPKIDLKHLQKPRENIQWAWAQARNLSPAVKDMGLGKILSLYLVHGCVVTPCLTYWACIPPPPWTQVPPLSPTYSGAGAHIKLKMLGYSQRVWTYFSSLMNSSTFHEPSAPLKNFLGPHVDPLVFFTNLIRIVLNIIQLKISQGWSYTLAPLFTKWQDSWVINTL
jgi:hypothetical protein